MSAAAARTEKNIAKQFVIYSSQREEVPDPQQWRNLYGFYLFKKPTVSNVCYSLVIGPEGTLYEGGILFLKITFPSNYPFSPPEIENLLSFPKQFNSNLWSHDVKQTLLTRTGEYRPYYGLVCMDILNTPHSKISTNSWNEAVEVYDNSIELYSPAINMNNMLITLRSNILNGETRCTYVNDDLLRYLILVYLAYNSFEEIAKEEYQDLQDFDGRSILQVALEIKNHYLKHYQKVASELLTKSEELSKEVKKFEGEVLKKLSEL